MNQIMRPFVDLVKRNRLEISIMDASQCRMARVGLGLSVKALAELAQVSTNTLIRLEAGELLRSRTIEAIRTALESVGVEFISENGGGAGVRLPKRQSLQMTNRDLARTFAKFRGDTLQRMNEGLSASDLLGLDDDGTLKAGSVTIGHVYLGDRGMIYDPDVAANEPNRDRPGLATLEGWVLRAQARNLEVPLPTLVPKGRRA